MDSFELNKIAGAVLGAALAIVAINEFANLAVAPHTLEKAAYAIDTGEADTAVAATTGGAAEEGPSLGALLATADIAKGQKVFKKCGTCHTSEEGGANKIGPNLYAIVGRAKGASSGFSYSDALVSMGGDWSYEDLDAFLKKPKDFMKGTKMSFSGIKKPADRADLVLFLRSLGSDAVALPSAN